MQEKILFVPVAYKEAKNLRDRSGQTIKGFNVAGWTEPGAVDGSAKNGWLRIWANYEDSFEDLEFHGSAREFTPELAQEIDVFTKVDMFNGGVKYSLDQFSKDSED